MISSPDGHCRAFDAQAQGTVGSNGVGIVVFKRLEEAIADGDRIQSVINGAHTFTPHTISRPPVPTFAPFGPWCSYYAYPTHIPPIITLLLSPIFSCSLLAFCVPSYCTSLILVRSSPSLIWRFLPFLLSPRFSFLFSLLELPRSCAFSVFCLLYFLFIFFLNFILSSIQFSAFSLRSQLIVILHYSLLVIILLFFSYSLPSSFSPLLFLSSVFLSAFLMFPYSPPALSSRNFLLLYLPCFSTLCLLAFLSFSSFFFLFLFLFISSFPSLFSSPPLLTPLFRSMVALLVRAPAVIFPLCPAHLFTLIFSIHSLICIICSD
ncbi:membrane protein [Beggiatoa sp. SS]|nr:membrane protein [Beggiatoa sp. SS]